MIEGRLVGFEFQSLPEKPFIVGQLFLIRLSRTLGPLAAVNVATVSVVVILIVRKVSCLGFRDCRKSRSLLVDRLSPLAR